MDPCIADAARATKAYASLTELIQNRGNFCNYFVLDKKLILRNLRAMQRDFQRTMLGLTVAASLIPACGGAVGEKLRPNDHTATSAMAGQGGKACAGSPKYAKPLIVDLEPDTRLDLEAAMKRGVVVVNYDCASIRVLATCKLPEGVYEYAGTTRREQVLQIKNADELGANLPLSQGKFSAELVSGRTIDLALVYVGQRSTTANKVTKEQLTGGCDDATHYVQMATLGAFSMQTGSVGKVAAVAEMFGRGAKGGSTSERKAMTTDGSLDDCRTSKAESDTPPGECAAPLRVELVPIGGIEESKSGGKKGDKKDDKKEATVAQNPCPPGFAMNDGICTRDANAAFVCEAKNEVQCKEQCDKGSMESCYNYALIVGKGATRAQAIPYFRKACDASLPDACASLGVQLIPDDEDPDVVAKAKDALSYLKKACDAGAGRGCEYAGDMLAEKFYKIQDIAAGVRAYDRGCDLGNAMSCWSLAQMYFKGKDVPKDGKRGVALLTKACLGGSADECDDLAKVYLEGTEGVAPDSQASIRAARRACEIDTDYCAYSVKYATKLGDLNTAFAFATRGCNAKDEEACNQLATMYENGQGTPVDLAKADAAHRRACKDGDGDENSCKKLGIKMKD